MLGTVPSFCQAICQGTLEMFVEQFTTGTEAHGTQKEQRNERFPSAGLELRGQ